MSHQHPQSSPQFRLNLCNQVLTLTEKRCILIQNLFYGYYMYSTLLLLIGALLVVIVVVAVVSSKFIN